MRLPALLTGLTLCLAANPSSAQVDYERWPLLKDPFESTGGGGILIGGYDPVVKDGKCTTDFTATEPGPNGKIYRNEVVFDAVPTQGGTLCTNGKWRSKDGSMKGTTPFEVFIKGGIKRMRP